CTLYRSDVNPRDVIQADLRTSPTRRSSDLRVHLYDRLFADPHPDGGDKDFLTCLSPKSRETVNAWLEPGTVAAPGATWQFERLRSEEHTSELQSRENLVCRLLLEKKDNRKE